MYDRECAVPQHLAHKVSPKERGLDAEFVRSPKLQQAYAQWYAQHGEANLQLRECQGPYKPSFPAHSHPRPAHAGEHRQPTSDHNPGPTTTWDSDCTFAAAMAPTQNLSCHTWFNGLGFAQDKTPKVFRGSDSELPLHLRAMYTIATLMMIQTWVYI
ncbi:hypothetical protein H4R24_005633 [Coemansia sp. RSA 988]|nr:hypothetical protein H4R24_005633 [Coemansia sp. RSA 988]